MVSVIICKHGKLGYTASLRFDDRRKDVDISSVNKFSLYKTIEYKLRQADRTVVSEGKN